MSQILMQYLGKKIKVVLNFSGQPIIYTGFLKDVSEKFIVIDEIKRGPTTIAIDDISTIYEVTEGGR